MRFSQTDTRRFIAAETAELARLAKKAKLETVAYFLELAGSEAKKPVVAEPKPNEAPRAHRRARQPDAGHVAPAP